MSNMCRLAINFLDNMRKKTFFSLSGAQARPGVTDEEIMNLENKLAIIEWLRALVKAEAEKEETR